MCKSEPNVTISINYRQKCRSSMGVLIILGLLDWYLLDQSIGHSIISTCWSKRIIIFTCERVTFSQWPILILLHVEIRIVFGRGLYLWTLSTESWRSSPFEWDASDDSRLGSLTIQTLRFNSKKLFTVRYNRYL